jgi:hypothetical protein
MKFHRFDLSRRSIHLDNQLVVPNRYEVANRNTPMQDGDKSTTLLVTHLLKQVCKTYQALVQRPPFPSAFTFPQFNPDRILQNVRPIETIEPRGIVKEMFINRKLNCVGSISGALSSYLYSKFLCKTRAQVTSGNVDPNAEGLIVSAGPSLHNSKQMLQITRTNSWKCKVLNIQFENETQPNERNHDVDNIFLSEKEGRLALGTDRPGNRDSSDFSSIHRIVSRAASRSCHLTTRVTFKA